MKQSSFFMSRSLLIYPIFLLLMLGLAADSFATNGYFAHGYSIKNKSMAGAGTALPLDSLAATNNPAGMAFVGNRIEYGLSFFNPVREYTVSGAVGNLDLGTIESDRSLFVVPYIGFNKMLSSKNSLGVAVYGNGGMNTDYDARTYPGTGSTKHTGIDLSQLFIAPTYSLKVTNDHAFGISVIGAYQTFEAVGLGSFSNLSQDSGNLTNETHSNSFGYGARIGYYGKIIEGLSFGASYQTRTYMNNFDEYAGLFAEKGDFDIPSNWNIGLAWQAAPSVTLVADMQQINYSDVDSIGNKFNQAFNNCYGAVLGGANPSTQSQCLGGSNGVGFGWEDMTIYKFGIQWKSSNEWTWRAGYSYGQQPIPDSEVLFNMLAPGVIEQHITAGFTKNIGLSQELDVSLMHALANDVSGRNPNDPGQTIKLEMNQWEASVGYAFKF